MLSRFRAVGYTGLAETGQGAHAAHPEHPSEPSCLAGLVLSLLPTLKNRELQAGDGAKAETGQRSRGCWAVEGTAKVGVEGGQRGVEPWDRTVEGSAHPMQDRLARDMGTFSCSLFGFQ